MIHLFSFRNLEAFELDERAQQQHLENLEEIEQALDAEFGISNVEEESGSAQNTDDDDDSTNQIRCIVCEKTFKSRSAGTVLVNMMNIIYSDKCWPITSDQKSIGKC